MIFSTPQMKNWIKFVIIIFIFIWFKFIKEKLPKIVPISLIFLCLLVSLLFFRIINRLFKLQQKNFKITEILSENLNPVLELLTTNILIAWFNSKIHLFIKYILFLLFLKNFIILMPLFMYIFIYTSCFC